MLIALGVSIGCSGGAEKGDAGPDAAGSDTAGTGSDVASCAGGLPLDLVEGCALTASSSQLTALWSGPVTVSEVTPTTPGNCAAGFADSGNGAGATTRLSVSAGNQNFVLFLRIPDLPVGFFKTGDTFDLEAGPGYGGMQVVVLSRAGALVAFTASYSSFLRPIPLPMLEELGVTVSDSGPMCDPQPSDCVTERHRVHVTNGAASADVAVGATAHVGNLSVTLDQYQLTYCIDGNQTMQVGGFVAP